MAPHNTPFGQPKGCVQQSSRRVRFRWYLLPLFFCVWPARRIDPQSGWSGWLSAIGLHIGALVLLAAVLCLLCILPRVLRKDSGDSP